MAPSRVQVYFQTREVSKVLFVVLKRRKQDGKKRYPHRPIRFLIGQLLAPASEPSEENPYYVDVQADTVGQNHKLIIMALGLRANGRVIATAAAPLVERFPN